jgi:exportin-1
MNAKENQSRCENALSILKLLSEEVFDFSKNALLKSQAKQLKDSMTNDFATIFELCMWVLQLAINDPQNIKPSLVRSCLKTFQAFLSWIPLAYIFETELIPIIINNFLGPASSRIEAIRCFTEIASLQLDDSDEAEKRSCKEKICMYFCLFIQKITEITKNRSLVDEFKTL